MDDPVRHVFDEALRLPLDQRADLAAELLRSLDDEEPVLPSEEIERQWGRRSRGAPSGPSAASRLVSMPRPT